MKDYPDIGATLAEVPHPRTRRRVIVVQSGARHGYAFPRILDEAGLLLRLETTTVSDTTKRFGPVSWMRRPPTGLAPDRVRSSTAPDIARVLARAAGRPVLAARQVQNAVLGRYALSREPKEGQIVFSVDGNGGPKALAAMKASGARIIVDVAITPNAYAAMDRSEARNPTWCRGVETRSNAADFRAHYDALVRVADLVCYPSNAVLEGLRSLPSFDETRSAELRYPTHIEDVHRGTPEPGHVLFVGNDAVRKGLPELASAVDLLWRAGGTQTLSVAGKLPEDLLCHPGLADAHIMGYLSRRPLAKLRARADCFVLASCAEGLPAAGIEAMAAGLPVIATPEAGLPVQNGINGFLVPGGDVAALSAAIRKVTESRGLRDGMSRAACETAKHYTAERVKSDLVRCLAKVEQAR